MAEASALAGDTPAHTVDAFHRGRFWLVQPRTGHRAGMDAMMLAAAVPSAFAGRLADFGAGAGAAGLAVLSRCPEAEVVLDERSTPQVMSLKETLISFLNHSRNVLIRRSKHRLGEIEKRLEILAGYLIAYLNIDEVIRIIREEDEPKQVMMARWSLTDTQAEAILNMRLRALRKLEEIEIRKEFEGLTKEKKQIEALLASNKKQWQTIRWQVEETRKKFGPDTKIVAIRMRDLRRADSSRYGS